ncbi:hypothetical protein DK750_02980 [Salmonella enterica subsp. enterica serovar Rovaniemi]|nr:hypothetical protein [Salmonella enterica subsp. enterica serovar Rovaniemi]
MNPTECLNAVMRKYPDAGKQIYRHRMERGTYRPRWPSWCFLPSTAWMDITGTAPGQIQRAVDTVQLAALGTWRYSQGIYRPDPDFARALSECDISGALPADVFQRLPEWCIYVETPEMTWCGDRVSGFWAHLDYRSDDSQYGELNLLFNCENLGYEMSTALSLGPWSIRDGYRKTAERGAEKLRKTQPQLAIEILRHATETIDERMAELAPAISILLYICSDEPEIADDKSPGETPSQPMEKKTKKGVRIFPASAPRIWTLGGGVGDMLREAYTLGPTGKTKRPHLRRGHWHGYWRGQRDGERQFSYKWLPPVFINGRSWMKE